MWYKRDENVINGLLKELSRILFICRIHRWQYYIWGLGHCIMFPLICANCSSFDEWKQDVK